MGLDLVDMCDKLSKDSSKMRSRRKRKMLINKLRNIKGFLQGDAKNYMRYLTKLKEIVLKHWQDTQGEKNPTTGQEITWDRPCTSDEELICDEPEISTYMYDIIPPRTQWCEETKLHCSCEKMGIGSANPCGIDLAVRCDGEKTEASDYDQ